MDVDPGSDPKRPASRRVGFLSFFNLHKLIPCFALAGVQAQATRSGTTGEKKKIKKIRNGNAGRSKEESRRSQAEASLHLRQLQELLRLSSNFSFPLSFFLGPKPVLSRFFFLLNQLSFIYLSFTIVFRPN